MTRVRENRRSDGEQEHHRRQRQSHQHTSGPDVAFAAEALLLEFNSSSC